MVVKRKKRINTGAIGMGVFVMLIMVASLFAVLNSQNNNNPDLDYNGFKFRIDQQSGQYLTSINNQQHAFYFHPSQLEYLNFTPEMKNLLSDSDFIVVGFDPRIDQQKLLYTDVFRFDLQNNIDKQVVGAVTQQSDKYDFAVFNCENSTTQTPMILLNDSPDGTITQQDSCIIVNARGNDLLKARDIILYNLLGVMDE